MKFKSKLLMAAALVTAAPIGLLSQGAMAQDDVEEIVVTGSHIRGTPENAELPVDVLRRADLEELGSPTLIEMVRNIGAASGNIGETNQFQAGGQANEGTASVNLRGLGAARTLVLLNGRRHVPTNFQGVDISFMPSSAIGRIEVLKDGAAATYGSDAIGGVVNFITRSGFEGLEVSASQQFIDGSDGDTELNGIFGWSKGNMNFILAAEYKHRGELQVRDRDWALQPYAVAPESGWSSIGNPGTLIGNPLLPGGIDAALAADPNCEVLGGELGGGFCRFQYAFYDNLIEEEDHNNWYSEMTFDLASGGQFYVEAGWSKVEVPEWNTSPSYPPQSLTGFDRAVFATHPGLQALFADNPAWAAANFPGGPQTILTFSRMAGVAGLDGEPETGYRETETQRFVTGLDGTMYNDTVDYSVSLSYSNRDRTFATDDMYVERMAFALDGLGGANCDWATGVPGVGNCSYYNPFSNAIAVSPVNGFVNPQYDPALANSPEMLDWLTDTLGTDLNNELLVLDAVFSGMTGWQFGGGEAGYAFGAQLRKEEYSSTPWAVNDLTQNPCPFTDPQALLRGYTGSLACAAPTGMFAFLSGSLPVSDDRTVWAAFGELALPITDSLNMQLALRYEDYGGQTGSTTDPKVAVHWQINDVFAMRASASSTFRGPSLASLAGRNTALEFVAATTAFKAVDTLGNPNLKPESAITLNLGFLMDTGSFSGSVDYWSFDFQDRIGTESAGQIVSAYIAGGCDTILVGDCVALRSHIFPTGTAAGGIERIEANWINGGDVETSGIDFQAQYQFDLENATLTVGTEGTHIIEYVSDDFKDISGVTLASGGDFVGFFNETNPFTPLPQLKATIFATYDRGPHNMRYAMRYVDDYKDGVLLSTIDSMTTHDIHYNYLWNESTRLSLSVFNVADEDPPFAAADLNYDPFTHSAFGRMFKIGVTHTFY